MLRQFYFLYNPSDESLEGLAGIRSGCRGRQLAPYDPSSEGVGGFSENPRARPTKLLDYIYHGAEGLEEYSWSRGGGAQDDGTHKQKTPKSVTVQRFFLRF